MIHLISVISIGILFSFFLFPITFSFLPIGNTKIYLALLGLMTLIYDKICNKEQTFGRSMLIVSFNAFLVSIVSICSLAYNGTNDTTYTLYLVQMWVWASAAYFVVRCMEKFHGRISVELIGIYLVTVCAFQCLFALMNEFIPIFKAFIDTFIEQNHAALDHIKRMYGIGASLDTAGSRFSCALILLASILVKKAQSLSGNLHVSLLVFLFLFVLFIGSMVARTTLIGAFIGIAYLIYSFSKKGGTYLKKVCLSFVMFLVGALFIFTLLYVISPEMKKLIRFAFEPFFNFWELGNMETSSTNQLLLMWEKIPQDLKTWIIGDGYFLSPYYSDPYYIGNQVGVFYMGTDVGYLRFIFYFGIMGLSVFSTFFIVCMRQCSRRYPLDNKMFVLLLLMNFILWLKVATDIFCVFSLFLVANKESNNSPKMCC